MDFPEDRKFQTEQDPMSAKLQDSHISQILKGARATLEEPTRPETPGDLPRHLFVGNDYADRPGSAIKTGSIAETAQQEFSNLTRPKLATVRRNPRAVANGKLPQLKTTKKMSATIKPGDLKRPSSKKRKVVLNPAAVTGRNNFKTFKTSKPIKPDAKIDIKSQKEQADLTLEDCKIDADKIKSEREELMKTQKALMESISINKANEADELGDLAALEDEENKLETDLIDELVGILDKEKNSEITKRCELEDEIETKEREKGMREAPESDVPTTDLDDIDGGLDDLDDDNLPTEALIEDQETENISGYEKTYQKLMEKLNALLEAGNDHTIEVISDVCSQVWSLAEDW